MISNKVYVVKKESVIAGINLTLVKGQELEVVMDVVYMGGFPVQTTLQSAMLDWIIANPALLTDVTK